MKIYLPIHWNNESIWSDSYWVFMNTLMNCITLDTPIEILHVPDDINVIRSATTL